MKHEMMIKIFNNKIYNINFAYPTNKFYLYNNVRTNEKKYLFSYIIPGKSKYNYNKEIDYIIDTIKELFMKYSK